VKTQLFTAASLVFAVMVGSAVAQQTQSLERAELSLPFASDDERAMYNDNRDIMSAFFTDETMATMRSEEEVKSAFAAMDRDSQAGMKDACTKAMENRGSYGTVTTSLCTQIMAN
jgi:hypothetical protein